MPHSVLTGKGQITIPISIRRQLNLKTGDRIEFEVESGSMRLIPATKTVDEVFGMLSNRSRGSYSIEEIRDALTMKIADKAK